LSSAEFQGFYSDLFRFQAKNTVVFYLLFAGLLTIAFLTSIFPASIFGVLAGALFGLFKGFIISALSALVAALVAFIFARYFFRAASRAVVAKVIDLERTEARLTKHGWRYALLIRSAPIAPFGITSYALGLTTIGLGEYLLTTLATFPFLLTCVYLGSSGAVIVQGGQIDGDSIRQLAVLFTGASLTFWLVTRLLPKLWLRLFPSDS
jgi:uncharacterized membrane protein YdjX (TVP38/TMEM64 family)